MGDGATIRVGLGAPLWAKWRALESGDGEAPTPVFCDNFRPKAEQIRPECLGHQAEVFPEASSPGGTGG